MVSHKVDLGLPIAPVCGMKVGMRRGLADGRDRGLPSARRR